MNIICEILSNRRNPRFYHISLRPLLTGFCQLRFLLGQELLLALAVLRQLMQLLLECRQLAFRYLIHPLGLRSRKQPKATRRAPAARKAISFEISTYCLLVPFAHVVTLPANVIMVCPLPSHKDMVWVAVMEAALAGFVLRAPIRNVSR